MTVGELKKELSRYNDDMPIFMENLGYFLPMDGFKLVYSRIFKDNTIRQGNVLVAEDRGWLEADGDVEFFEE
jgi:hypothetical protein